MEKFIKITEDIYYDTDRKDDIKKYLTDEVSTDLMALSADFQMNIEESLIDCESPIEQLLAMYLENMNLRNIYLYNPYIDVVEIEKQVEIKCVQRKYRVDFLIPVVYKNQENKCFVIECDGHEFHQKTKEQVERDNTRTRDLQKAGYETIRFSGTEIWHRPHRCANEVLNIILSKCKYAKEEK